MIKHLPAYRVHEYGAALEEGYFCPLCREARLMVSEPGVHPAPDQLTCPHCAGVFASGWRRHTWNTHPPQALKGTPVNRLGGFFETIQAYQVAPRLPETVDETPLSHLADFVVDIDRDAMIDAQVAALTVFDFLDALAPGQVRAYFSGSKGYHIIVPWQTLGAVPSPTLNQREYRHLAGIVARRTGVVPDYKIYSPGRMLRMPDSWHPKSGRYKIEVLRDEIEGAAMLAIAPRGVLNDTEPQLSGPMHELYLSACERAEEQDKYSATPRLTFPTFKGAPPCVQQVLTGGLPYKGSRHAVYLLLARYWNSAGISPEERGGFSGHQLTGGAISLGRDFAIQDDPNTNTPQSVRIRDMEDTVKYVYRNEMKFSCTGPKSVGLCHESCPLRQMEDFTMSPGSPVLIV